MKSRGQSALEYLITYGWALLAMVIIAGVLWYFGVFDPVKWSGEKQCGGFSAFICQDFRISTNGTLVIVLNNKAGTTITAVNFSNGTTAMNCSPSTISPSSNTTCVYSQFVTGGNSGDQMDQKAISLNYTNSKSGIAHIDVGFIKAKYE